MPATFDSELGVAIEAVRTAARVCRSVQEKITPDVLEKDDRSPVTVADFASQAVICRAIGAAFPSDPIIGEEESSTLKKEENGPFLDRILVELRGVGIETCGKEACAWIDRASQKTYVPRFWTLDPIDGTKGFLRKEQYAISLALIVEGRIQVALLGCPNLPCEPEGTRTGALFYAIRGGGSWAVPLDGDGSPRPIHASQESD